MTRVLTLAVFLLPAAAPAADPEGPPKRDRAPAPELSVRQDGDDLVVTSSIRANNSPHVLLTGHAVQGKQVVLRYTLIQNADRLVRGDGDTRSVKQVKAEWRLKGLKKDAAEFRVDDHLLLLTTAELEKLGKEVGTLVPKPAE